MKSSVIAVIVTGCVGASEPTVEQTTQSVAGQVVQHFTMHGAGADLASNPVGDTLSVMENQTGNTRVVQLMYALTTPDPASQICYPYGDGLSYCTYYRIFYDSGLGTIPGDDFTASAQSAHLHTTLTGTTTIGAMHCVADYLNGIFDCEPSAPVGDIDVAWIQDNTGYSFSQSGTSEGGFGPFTSRTSGTYRTSWAHGSGTILGKPIDGAGILSDTHQSIVSRDIVSNH